MWSSFSLNIRTEKYLRLFNQDTIFLTFRRGYSGTVSFCSLQTSKQYHYHHHLSFVASGDHSQDQHSAVPATAHTDKERRSLLWRAYNLNRYKGKREVYDSLHVRKNVEVVLGEPVYTGDSLYSGVGNLTCRRMSNGKQGIFGAVVFCCFFLQQDRSAHNLIICPLIATSSWKSIFAWQWLWRQAEANVNINKKT